MVKVEVVSSVAVMALVMGHAAGNMDMAMDLCAALAIIMPRKMYRHADGASSTFTAPMCCSLVSSNFRKNSQSHIQHSILCKRAKMVPVTD